MRIFAALGIALTASVLAGAAARAENRTFIIPSNADGYGVDRCLVNGERCGTPVANAKIEVWRRVKAQNIELFHQEPGGAAGEDGRFAICGTPLDQVLRIRASDARESGEIIVDKWNDGVFIATLFVRGGQ